MAPRPPISIPRIGTAVEKLFEPKIRAVLLEAPGSQSFEMPARNRSRPRDLETGFQRRLRPIQHGPFLGRVREPGHSVRLHGLSIRHQMGAGGTGRRLHIGLENVDDLKADLERGFAAFHAA
jgi:cystathionine beta-lyase/cystathionine gamma-synthase